MLAVLTQNLQPTARTTDHPTIDSSLNSRPERNLAVVRFGHEVVYRMLPALKQKSGCPSVLDFLQYFLSLGIRLSFLEFADKIHSLNCGGGNDFLIRLKYRQAEQSVMVRRLFGWRNAKPFVVRIECFVHRKAQCIANPTNGRLRL